MIIAIDGPAASGKGTLARRLAQHYGYRHLDTGVIYRAVANALIEKGAEASVVSAIPRVREALLDFQRQFAATPPGAVLDGRDIGTVICPDAEVKIFVVADPKVRAHRRMLEAKSRGEAADEAKILEDIIRRDERDRTRASAPLKQAADAYLLDNTNLDIEAGVRAAIDIVEAVRAGRQRG
jgi:CMP/dCMP kinase